MSPSPQKELLIWWTSNAEILAIGERAPTALPEYVRAQYHERRAQYARAGDPTTLWVDKKFGLREIKEWPDTFIGRMLRDGTSQGVVVVGGDLGCFEGIAGVVTDFRLHLVVI